MADVRNLPFKDKSFNLVYCKHVLEHLIEDVAYGIQDETKALREIHRVLKKNGKVLIIVPWLWDAIAYDHKRCWVPRTWKNLIEQNGFKTTFKGYPLCHITPRLKILGIKK